MEKNDFTEMVNKSLVSVVNLFFCYLQTTILLLFRSNKLKSYQNKLNGYVMLAVNIFLSVTVTKWILGIFLFTFVSLLRSCENYDVTKVPLPELPSILSEFSLIMSLNEFTKVVLPSFFIFLILISLFDKIHGKSERYCSVLLYTLAHWLLSMPLVLFVFYKLSNFISEQSVMTFTSTMSLVLIFSFLWPGMFFFKYYKNNIENYKNQFKVFCIGILFIVISVAFYGLIVAIEFIRIVKENKFQIPYIEGFVVDENDFVLTILLKNNDKNPVYLQTDSSFILEESSHHHLVKIDGSETIVILYSASDDTREKLQDCTETFDESPLIKRYAWHRRNDISPRLVRSKADMAAYRECRMNVLTFEESFKFLNDDGESFHIRFNLSPVNYVQDIDSKL
ncbi:hypothetical protein Q4574_07720 [Aliiglaciecola sp. 3_MG-2023]|uniref:hypothetical protein n=1 Tax=Aliiglaciecola sp. 3_MG-2023 TaxID=3062644 RepID=UPI0026E45494|nr:hypothetical protein [Aliiglaciecola sp. 3_MG-2023]MDO6693169.1 hypothetical protein [Aliiglaciecola sp. 3_MG-2023]